MLLSDFKKEYIQETKIELDDSNYVVLREPTTLEFKEIGEDTKANIEVLVKLFPTCLIDHTFEKEEGKKANNKEVADAIISSGVQFLDIVQIWLESLKIKKKTKVT